MPTMITDDQIKALNPEMAATYIVGMGSTTGAQYRVLTIACRNGGYVQAGTGEHQGHVERVPASALRALIQRGHLTHCYGSEGGLAGRLSQQAREKLAEALASQKTPSGEQLAAQLAGVMQRMQAAAAALPIETASEVSVREDRERAMFGCTADAIDEVLDGMSPRDVAMYAMGTLSNAQQLIRRDTYEGTTEWTVANHHDADTIRRLINVAKYAIDKAVSR